MLVTVTMGEINESTAGGQITLVSGLVVPLLAKGLMAVFFIILYSSLEFSEEIPYHN